MARQCESISSNNDHSQTERSGDEWKAFMQKRSGGAARSLVHRVLRNARGTLVGTNLGQGRVTVGSAANRLPIELDGVQSPVYLGLNFVLISECTASQSRDVVKVYKETV
jgi:hypothetical protein